MQSALNNVDARAPSARVYEDGLDLTKTLQGGADVGLESYLVVGSRQRLSTIYRRRGVGLRVSDLTCLREVGCSKTGKLESRFGEKDGEIRSQCMGATVRVRMGMDEQTGSASSASGTGDEVCWDFGNCQDVDSD
jgi:hypothetical protein